jgi:branched-subunit amino acid transport protein
MDQQVVFLTLLGMMVVTYAPRALPVLALSSRRLPPVVAAWLRQVPVAVLAAMLAPALFVQGKRVSLGLDNLFLWAAVPAFLVAWRRRSFFGTVIVGIVVVAVARLVLGI